MENHEIKNNKKKVKLYLWRIENICVWLRNEQNERTPKKFFQLKIEVKTLRFFQKKNIFLIFFSSQNFSSNMENVNLLHNFL